MPLQQLCSSNKGQDNSNAFITPVHAQGVYDVDYSRPPMERCGSQASALSFTKDICRICHCEGDGETILIVPCYCSGSLRYVHQNCLQQWIKSSNTKCCELCKYPFIMQSKVKPFQKWERLEMSGIERRKLVFSVMFHVTAIFCVVWSLYILIERTYNDVENGELAWPFWTKVIVVAVGVAGGIVFTYVQCKMYVQLCRRWRAYNRVIFIQNAPEKVLHRMDSPRGDFEIEIDSKKPTFSVADESTLNSGGGGPFPLTDYSVNPNSNTTGTCPGIECFRPQLHRPHEGSLQFINVNENSDERISEETDSLLRKSARIDCEVRGPPLGSSKSVPTLIDVSSSSKVALET